VTAQYFARRTGGWPDAGERFRGPFSTYSQAAKVGADFLAGQAVALEREHRPKFAVLLELTNLDMSEDETRLLLATDPAVRAVFELGRRVGREEGAAWERGEIPPIILT
jgi:hypothetical protein